MGIDNCPPLHHPVVELENESTINRSCCYVHIKSFAHLFSSLIGQSAASAVPWLIKSASQGHGRVNLKVI